MVKHLVQATLIGIIVFSSFVSARPEFQFPRSGKNEVQAPLANYEFPNSSFEYHKINRMGLTVTNSGNFGTGYIGTPTDPETGQRIFGCEYPRNSNVEFLWIGGIWIGAVIGRDTLVSTAAEGYYNIVEFWPDAGLSGQMTRRSSQPFSTFYSPKAVSEEDVICSYTDTVTNASVVNVDPIDNRPHHPLNIEITQRNFAWSYPYADDFILLDYAIRNVGPYPLKSIYIGIVNDADAYHISKSWGGDSWLDDICGFKKTIPSPNFPGYEDSIMVAWVADNDGDPINGVYDFSSTTGVTATRVIRTPSDSLEYSFNWWVTQYTPTGDWGPRQITEDKPFRDFGPNFGSPLGDKNKYYMLSTREFDYDQLECALPHPDEGWMAPDRNAPDFADGHNSIYLFSFGPFDLPPDSTLPVTLAYIGGEGFHHDPTAFENVYNPYNPGQFQNQLDFSNLGSNAIWADWVYDNPGYDTDGDGDSGLAKWYVNDLGTDSTYAFYRGDGVPDFRGAAPPPSPPLTIIPKYGRLTLHWNGQVSENAIDVFSGEKDFEGYKVYFGEGDRLSDFVLAATHDRRNYNVHSWNDILRRWEISTAPLSYDSLEILYSPGFDPDFYDENNQLPPTASINPTGQYVYFTPQFWNNSDLSNPHQIHRIYPNADLNDPSDTTDAGFHRFYEYEYTIENLSPTRLQYVAVTAFDYGSRSHQLSALESSPLENATPAYPLSSVDEVEELGLEVTVYPNPYRIDGGYANVGYENRDRTKSSERARAVNFANLPKICKIRIYTLSGDLVKEIDHYRPDGGPDAQVETWSMLSRNTQVITTGIYIWSVTSEMGDQLGKLVIIK